MTRMTRTLGAVVGSMALAAIPTTRGEAIPETEPNDTFPGQPATVGVTYTGTVCPTCSPPFTDPIDFFHYTGLAPGTSFDLSFTPTSIIISGHTLEVGLYTDGTTITSFKTSSGPTVDLTGTVGAGGALTFGVTELSATDTESYSLKLTATPAVPEPATLVLLAAGLTAAGIGAAGVGAARRRKR